MHSQPWREDAAFGESQEQGTGHPDTAFTCSCPLEKLQEWKWRKRVAGLKRNARKGKDNKEEVGFKAEWGAAISEEEKKEVEIREAKCESKSWWEQQKNKAERK